MFSTELITDYCKNIQKDIDTLGKVLNYAEKLKKSKNPNDNLAKRKLRDYDSIETMASGHSRVSPMAKKIQSYLSKFHNQSMKSLKGIQETAIKLCDIKEIYKAKNIKNTGLNKLRKICENSSLLKDKVEFKCSKNMEELSIEVSNFLKSVKETTKKIKNLPTSSNKDPIRGEIEIVNKYYRALKSENKKFLDNFSNIEKNCQELKNHILSEVGRLSEENKKLIEIAKYTSSDVTKQDEQAYEEKIKEFSKNFAQVVATLAESKIDKSAFDYLKKFRNLEKNILAVPDNSVGISISNAKKRILTLDKRCNLFNKAVIEGNYNNGDKSAWSIIKKNLEKIKQINESLKSNNENEVDIEEIKSAADDYVKNTSTTTLDVEKFLESTKPENLKGQISYIEKFKNEEDSIKNLEAEMALVKEKHGSTYASLFGLFVIRNIYIEILEYMVKTNEFLEKSSEEIDSCLEKFGKKKKGWLKKEIDKVLNSKVAAKVLHSKAATVLNNKVAPKMNKVLHSKFVTGITKFSAIGCFAGVAISHISPPVGIAIATISLIGTSLQTLQAWTS